MQTGTGAELSQLAPEQAATRTWTPEAATWAKIKQSSVKSPATITITGFAAVSGDNASSPVPAGSVTISTSVDPVGAPVFYRDVPLMTSPHAVKGSIQPLPTSALPLIKWRARNIADPQSRTVMEGLYTCANCHSFSRDGKTLGIDVDGPENDKGLYALVPVAKDMTIRNQDVAPGQQALYRSAQQALDLAIQGHDPEMEKNLRAALERYERDGRKAQPR